MTTLILLWSAAVLASFTSGEPDGRNQGGTHYLIEVSDQGERAHCVDIEGNRRDKGEKWMEGCNTCICSMFSLTHGRKGECTRTDGCGDPRQCVDIRGNLREPGEKWKNPGDCNTCTCGGGFEPGTVSCTKKGCQDDSDPAPDWPTQVQKEQEQVGWGNWPSSWRPREGKSLGKICGIILLQNLTSNSKIVYQTIPIHLLIAQPNCFGYFKIYKSNKHGGQSATHTWTVSGIHVFLSTCQYPKHESNFLLHCSIGKRI